MTKHNDIHQDEDVCLYEIGYLVVPTVAQEQLPGVVEGVNKILKDNQAEMVLDGAPVMKELAYEIAKASVGKRQKFTTAYFGFVVFKTSPANAPAIKKAMDAEGKILRYILIKTDEETALTPPTVPASLLEDLEKMPEMAQQGQDDAKVAQEDIDKKIDTIATA